MKYCMGSMTALPIFFSSGEIRDLVGFQGMAIDLPVGNGGERGKNDEAN